jgi:hypothetical protein
MFNLRTRVFVLVSLIMASFNSYAAAVDITGDSQTYTNTGPLTGTPTDITLPDFPGINPIIGIYNAGSLNIIINATSGTINSSTGGIEFSFGVYSYGSNSFGFSRIMGKMNNNKLVNNYIVRMYSTTIFKFNA